MSNTGANTRGRRVRGTLPMSAEFRMRLGALALAMVLVTRPGAAASPPATAVGGAATPSVSGAGTADARQGLVIVKAQYGVPGQYLDVTAKVRDMVWENALDLRGHCESLFGDPAPGVYKSLVITYSHGTKEKTAVTSDYGILHLPLPEPRSKLVIVEAKYGAKKVYLDLKDTLQSMVDSDRLLLTRPLYKVFGDPLPGVPKTLKVQYRYNQPTPKTVTFKEGTVVSLP